MPEDVRAWICQFHEDDHYGRWPTTTITATACLGGGGDVRYASKNGTTAFISYMATRGLGRGCGLALDVRKFVKNTPDLVRKMLRKMTRSGIRPRGILMGGEFCNVTGMKAAEGS